MNRSTLIAISLLFAAAASFAEVSGEWPISEPAYGTPPGQRYGTAAAKGSGLPTIESLAPLAVTSNTTDPYASLIVTGLGRVTTVYTRVGSEAQYGDVERAFVSIPHTIRGRASR
ncbi:MAG TPA: hypothetical protein VGA84_05775 [Thermoanaerobaculia bacterium]